VNEVIGKAYGTDYITMNSKHIGADLVFAIDSAQIGMMDAKLAANIMYADTKDSLLIEEKTADYTSLQASVESAAKRGYVDSIIPAESMRKHLIFAYEMLFTKREGRPNKKHGTI